MFPRADPDNAGELDLTNGSLESLYEVDFYDLNAQNYKYLKQYN